MKYVTGPTSTPSELATISWSTDHSKVSMPDQPHIASLERTVTCRWSCPSRMRNCSQLLQGISLLSPPSERGSHRLMTARRESGCARSSSITCLLYTSDAADERSSVDLGG